MVHRKHRVEAAQLARQERGVGRQGADQVHAFAAQCFQHRDDRVDLLAAQVAALAGVRVQAQHRDHRRGDAEIVAQRRMRGPQHPAQQRRIDRIGDLAQRQVGGGQRDPDDVVGQHHHHLAAGMPGEQFGGAGVGDPAFVDGGLLHRPGDHAGEVAARAALGRREQGANHRMGVARIGPSEHGGVVVGNHAQRQVAGCPRRLVLVQQVERQRQRRGRGLQRGRIGESDQGAVGARPLGQAHAKFRSDPGRFARYQREPGQGHARPVSRRRAPGCRSRRRRGRRCGTPRRPRRASPAGSGCIPLPACAGRWSRGPGRGGCCR